MRYWGARRWPLAGLRQALVHRAPLVVPPPFDITVLSLDFFGRALVRLRLNAAEPGSKFLVLVPDGWYDIADPAQAEALAQAGEPGLCGAIEPLGGTDLFDLLNLPLMQHRPAEVTIALQRVDDQGGVGDLSAVRYSVPVLLA